MTREEILDKRRVEFEEWAEANHLWTHLSLGGSYANTLTMAAWIAWNAALDSVVIELPEKPKNSDEYDEMDLGYRVAITTCADLINKQGYRTK